MLPCIHSQLKQAVMIEDWLITGSSNTSVWSATGCQVKHTRSERVIIESKPQGEMQ